MQTTTLSSQGAGTGTTGAPALSFPRLRVPASARLLMLVCAALPALILAWLLYHYAVNCPHWDEWDQNLVLLKAREGSLTWADLLAQHNEHRLTVPRLVLLALAETGSLNTVHQSWVSFLFACVIAFLVYRLARATTDWRGWRLAAFSALANLLIFGPIQYANWLMGVQFLMFIPVACLCGCLLVLVSQAPPWEKALTTLVLSTLATFSVANGLLVWLISGSLLLGLCWGEFARRRGWLAVWLAACGANLYLYLHAYHTPAWHAPLSQFNLLAAGRYFVAFLGAPLGSGNDFRSVKFSTAFGLALLFLSVASAVAVFAFRRDRPFVRCAAPWLGLGAFALLSAGVAAIGRNASPVDQALSSRYTTFSVYLIVALVFVIPIVLEKIRARWPALTALGAARILTALCTVLLLNHAAASLAGAGSFQGTARERRQALACVLCLYSIQEPELERTTFPNLELLVQRVHAYDRYGLLQPRPLRGDLRALHLHRDSGARYGRMTLESTGVDAWRAAGWALSSDLSSPAASVVLAAEDSAGALAPVAVVCPSLPRDEEPGAGLCGWRKEFRCHLSAGMALSAWSLDPERGEAWELAGGHAPAP